MSSILIALTFVIGIYTLVSIIGYWHVSRSRVPMTLKTGSMALDLLVIGFWVWLAVSRGGAR